MSNEKGKAHQAAAPGMQKMHTITNKLTGENRQYSMADIKAMRDRLKAEGFTGTGLGDGEDDAAEVEQPDAPVPPVEGGSGQ